MKIVSFKFSLFALTTIFVTLIPFGFTTSVTSHSKGKLKNKQIQTSNSPKFIKPIIGDTSVNFEGLKLLVGKDKFQKQFSNSNDELETISRSVVKNSDGFDIIPKPTHVDNGEILVSPSFYDKAKPQQVITEPIEKTFSTPVKLNHPEQEVRFELPNFIHKNDQNIEQISTNDNKQEQNMEQQNQVTDNNQNVNPDTNNADAVKQDIQRFVAQLDNAKDKKERIQVLIDGKHRLGEEAKALGIQVENELKELLYSKEIAIKLKNLVEAYEKKLTKNNLSKLKLADILTIKDVLRNKLHREIQGFRTSQNEYKELELVNPDDISKIIEDIKSKLGQ